MRSPSHGMNERVSELPGYTVRYASVSIIFTVDYACLISFAVVFGLLVLVSLYFG